MMSRRHFIAALALLSVSAVTVPALADTQIHAEYTANYDRLRPDPHTGIHLKNGLDVTLSGSNNVQESNTRQTGKLSDNQSGRKILGQKSSEGGSWRVIGPNRLERTINNVQNVTVQTITVSGSSCTLDVQFKLKPGFSEFTFKQVRNGKLGYFTQPKVQSTSCTIR